MDADEAAVRLNTTFGIRTFYLIQGFPSVEVVRSCLNPQPVVGLTVAVNMASSSFGTFAIYEPVLHDVVVATPTNGTGALWCFSCRLLFASGSRAPPEITNISN